MDEVDDMADERATRCRGSMGCGLLDARKLGGKTESDRTPPMFSPLARTSMFFTIISTSPRSLGY
jgi:hypothetical protein